MPRAARGRAGRPTRGPVAAEGSASPSAAGVDPPRTAVLTMERFLRHPPETVWKALTDPEQLRRWFLTEARIEPGRGGSIELTTGPTQVRARGRILAWNPPHVYEYEWNVDPVSGMPHGERSVVRWELTPVPGGTRLVLMHKGLTAPTAETFRHGIPGFLERLSAQLDGRPLPDWMASVRAEREKAAARQNR
jgi:uncharacterized protein YndB with AHSA1/START domain